MKKISLLFSFCLLHFISIAQAPQGIPYQSVVRNGIGALLTNHPVNMRFSIHDSSMQGTIVYQETHNTATSNGGMVILNIGQGTPATGTFSAINWGVNAKYMQVELDTTTTGNNYVDLGTQALMSVPYALYAATSGNAQVGPQGATGANGVSVASSTITNDSLYLILSNGQTLNAGYVRGPQGIAGTFPNGTAAGQMLYWNGTAWVSVAPTTSLPGNQAKTLKFCNGAPTWEDCPAVIPTVTSTTSISGITYTTASSGGSISSDGGAAVTARGVCWSTTSNPTVALSTKTINGSGTGSFTSSITGLVAGTTYYVRAYATNSVGTAYGSQVVFATTAFTLATLTTTAVSNITNTAASSGGSISSDGGAAVTARGVCWSTSSNPTVALSTKTTDGSGIGSFTSSITGLVAGTTYYVRAYATNSVGTAYGSQVVFTTTAFTLATLTTTAVSNITNTDASSGGSISSDGGAAVTARGVCWSTTSNPTVALSTKTINGSGTGSFTSSITGLVAGTTYYVRAYATNSVGTAYGSQEVFTTTNNVLTIGQSYQGGIIAYILQPGDPGYDANVQHGLIAAPSDQSTGIVWWNGSFVTTGATATAMGAGNANTNTIVAVQGNGSYAAKLCYDLVLNGYSDWYLPSKDELNKLYLNRTAIGGFAAANYWSSSEGINSSAWDQSFNTGAQNYSNKNFTFAVRAVRAF